ncbi:alpha/beta hydrolase [Subtercola boreus]|uniref:Esterase n=1 Tax=Subtercola boreus TaxID=120213 RepID=A0A3E0WC52_9MICO|nr:alpha/beta hydrolase-fold protein [Subtercola boreus]RFA20817.1 hypothetical protein B7R24_08615 [Subtercola boreus]RFA20932.1 hypothetical protein B7R23_08555 [Subtercola boreus]RFA27125.1 hypothetical protein B7R25_08680 [Subtercola boreus]
MGSLGSTSIIDSPLVFGVYAVAAVIALLLLTVRPNRSWRRTRWLLVGLGSLVVGAVVGLLVAWIFGDLLDLFGVAFSFVTRCWIAAGFAALALAVSSLVAGRLGRRIVALFGAVVFAATSAMSFNIDIGTYPTLESLVGVSPYQSSTLPALGAATVLQAPLSSSWLPPAGLPTAGVVGTVHIPATVSGFDARDALVYLPPAALTADPPALPVVIALSGQPGDPADPLVSAHLTETLDSYARLHNGLAPIVVSPDQLGDPTNNPMCVDGALGNSATYLTVDVVTWITANLPVAASPDGWAIAGFSQGGTCSIQLGAGHPELFGSLLDISGELVPANGDTQATIQDGFGGNPGAYSDAQPLTILKKHTPYASTFAIFAVGANDLEYRAHTLVVSAAAKTAGMRTTYFEAPDSAHDYTTATYSFARGVGLLAANWGLGS